MWRKHAMVWAAVLAVGMAGCGDSATTGEVPASGDGGGQPAPLEPPAAAVAEFLDAARSGDSKRTAMMFTEAARQLVDELQIVISPPTSDTAEFVIGKVKYFGEDAARVACTLSDLDENSQRCSEEVIWMVRQEPEGWRIAGAATTSAEGQPSQAIDFEDRQQMAEMRQAQQGNAQAQRPEALEDPFRR